MAANRTAERISGEIIRLCHAGRDSHSLLCGVFDRLQRVVDYEAFWCATTDPDSLIFTSAVSGGFERETIPAYLSNEFLQDDFNKFSVLAKSRQPVTTLQMATRGDLTRSQRYRELLEPTGLGNEMRGVFRSGGVVWGGMCLHRLQRNPDFSAADVAFLTAIAPHLAAGLRAALLLNAVEIAPASAGPGLLLLADDLSIVSATPGAELLLAEVNDWPHGDALPQAVYAVIARLHALERDVQAGASGIPHARLRTRSGHWLALHASRLSNPASANQVAIIIEQATPSDVAPLVLQAYALTVRELEVAKLILKGRSTEEIAGQLYISSLTVQQHLKAIFDKVGVRSRRELVAQIFAQSYPII